MDKFVIDICGRKESLDILPLPSGIKIAFFNLHGNASLTEYCAKKLCDRIENLPFDVLLTAESKGLQLAHCLARNLRHDFYAVARKSKKLYMQDGISVTGDSITTGGSQTFYLSAFDTALLKGKRIAIIDDVVSTGGSLVALERLVELAGGTTALKACVLAEGEASSRKDLIYLSPLPIFCD